jgi:hypothetical protein
MIARYNVVAAALQLPRIRFGVGGVAFFPLDTLDEEQAGYDGPDWKESWLVVARDEACGDPIFIDAADPQFPVYTAMHGEGTWLARPIAPSLRKFSDALVFLQPFCVDRQHPAGLEANPVSSSERAAIFNGLRAIFGSPVASFWEALFDCEP